MRPFFGSRSEEVAKDDGRLIASRYFETWIVRIVAQVLVRIRGVDLRAEKIPEVADPGREAGALEHGVGVILVGIAAHHGDAGAHRKRGEHAVFAAEVVGELRA